MMNWIIPLTDIQDKDRRRVGGKCFALAVMAKCGFTVPFTVCVTTDVYDLFVARTGLRERIALELNRKDFHDMRWEELWDASLRIRNMFLRKSIPTPIYAGLKRFLESTFNDRPVVVRSSAPGEDAPGTSFAGLHDSFVNVVGVDDILEHIRFVWASLWSDAALLYRRELGLDIATSSMAVVVQEIILGDQSGVAFTRNPSDRSQGVIESVHGLNQGLVDGSVEPDRWILDRATGAIISHAEVPRERWVVPAGTGVRLDTLPEEKAERAPLDNSDVAAVFTTALELEGAFGTPQDVEWTFRRGALHILQSRPITAISSDRGEDERGWYLSLRKSYDTLRALRTKIENELLPRMVKEAERLAARDVEALSDDVLAEEIARRLELYKRWHDIYWDDFIPFAHGIRLFGQVYNNVMRPEDPYEFVDLLGDTQMVSLRRNRILENMAQEVRNDTALRKALTDRTSFGVPRDFLDEIATFASQFGDSFHFMAREDNDTVPEGLTAILLELADHPREGNRTKGNDVTARRDAFLNRFEGEERVRAEELFDLARTSYRMRDDDNICLGNIEREVYGAVDEGRKRLHNRGGSNVEQLTPDEVPEVLRGREVIGRGKRDNDRSLEHIAVKVLQLVGQPAGPGLASGTARVIVTPADLTDLKYGEILICDAIDPNMTFVVPLAAGIVERRGGMLIHGAIIAREYGLACVTGVANATTHIKTGDRVTVDGYLGIVIIDRDVREGQEPS